jgi:hypothetical protein
MRRIAPLLFREAPSVHIQVYGRPGATMDGDPAIRCTEMYAHYTRSLAPLGIYPEFDLDAGIDGETAAQLSHDATPGTPLVALHARQQPHEPEKSLRLDDLLELARRFIQRGFRLVCSATGRRPIF